VLIVDKTYTFLFERRAPFFFEHNQSLSNDDRRARVRRAVPTARNTRSASRCTPDVRLQASEHTRLADIFRVGFRVPWICSDAD
jgi:hypothetical protein